MSLISLLHTLTSPASFSDDLTGWKVDDKDYRYTLDLPGYKANQIRVQHSNGYLQIRGQTETRKCSHLISVPSGVSSDTQFNCTLEDGVLTIRMDRPVAQVQDIPVIEAPRSSN